MKTKLSCLITLLCTLFINGATAEVVEVKHPPSSTIVLKLPDHENWKEISRSVSENSGLVERIPNNQSIENWSELICIQYQKNDVFKSICIENIVNQLRETTLNSHPGNKVSWKILENSANDIIYEWILHKPCQDIPPQHEIARVFLTKNGEFHRIGFTRRNALMTPEERTNWIKLLRESITIVPWEKAAVDNDLSMVNKLKDTVDLGTVFKTWKIYTTSVFNSGLVASFYFPPQQKDNDEVTEFLQVVTSPLHAPSSLDQLFKIEIEHIQKPLPIRIKYQTLKKSPNEIVFSYSYVKDGHRFSNVTRLLVANHGQYSLTSTRILPKKLKTEEISSRKELLESINIQSYDR